MIEFFDYFEKDNESWNKKLSRKEYENLSEVKELSDIKSKLLKLKKNNIYDYQNIANYYKDSINIKAPSIEQKVGNLSGGNQQKVQIAKWMFAKPNVLILDEPTRGIDVGAKFEIYSLMNKLVDQGMSIIMISSELPEVLGMSDRLYVMSEGTITGELTAEEATEEKVMAMAISSMAEAS